MATRTPRPPGGAFKTPTDAEARSIGITDDRWPYGVGKDHQARRTLVDWATPRRLRLHSGADCLDWLLTSRCPHHGACPYKGWRDHVTAWTRDRKPAVVVAQPYSLAGDQLDEVANLQRAHDLQVIIDGTGWYGHGTTFIQVWAADPYAPPPT